MPESATFKPSLKPYIEVPASRREAKAKIASRLQDVGQAHPGQLAGTRWSIGCVSLEVTQRCNLDCSACYLSDDAELVPDIALSLLIARIGLIHQHYGPGCDIQISGGDPTLRPINDLLAIVREIRRLDMRSSLFTNGIKATRLMLASLASAGLNDVAFHVDVTQDRKGYTNEASLHALRDEYIARAQGLGLNIYFNTTVVQANFHEIQSVTQFFLARAEQVSFASFQMQAETGRGTLGERPGLITQTSVMQEIQRALGVALDFDVLTPGHRSCNRYATALVSQGRAFEAFAPQQAVRDFFKTSAAWRFDRSNFKNSALQFLRQFAMTPQSWKPGLTWLAASVWRMRKEIAGILLRRQKVTKLSFLVHNFMDAKALDLERTHACVFMAITDDGPLSMCAYNAQREYYLHGGKAEDQGIAANTNYAPIKFLKGRQRQAFLAARRTKVA